MTSCLKNIICSKIQSNNLGIDVHLSTSSCPSPRLIGIRKDEGSSESRMSVSSESVMSAGAGITSVWQILRNTFWEVIKFFVFTQNPVKEQNEIVHV